MTPKTKRAADLARGDVVTDRRQPGRVAEVVETRTIDGLALVDVRMAGSRFAHQWGADALVEVEGAT